MVEQTVQTYRIKGHYKNNRSVFKNAFDKEVRGLTPDDAVDSLRQLISSKNVHPNRIFIESVHRIDDPDQIKDRVIRTFASESLKV